ncbi:MAG TPA: SMC family ATPase [Streptosporangiaceae bacterium]
MRPLRLVLDGFGTYRNQTEVDFSDVDFFALTGPTGSGKSTVIDAICFALYGTVPRWDNEREVRNALAPSANACTVSLIFELAKQRYVAVRSLQRDRRGQVSTKAARLERLDPAIAADAPLAEILEASVEQLAEGPDHVRARASELLGLSYQHFIQSVLLPQGGFAEFLRATAGDRQKLLVELLAFGVYKDIGQRARERADRAKAQQAAAQQQRDRLADATEEAQAAAADRLTELTELTAQVETGLATLADLRTRAEAASQLAHQEGNVAAQLAAVRTPAAAGGLAEQIASAQTELAASRLRRDEAASQAEHAEQARAALPDKAVTQRWLESYALRRDLVAEATQQSATVAACAAREHEAATALQAAEGGTAAAQAALETAQRAHTAAGLAESLHAGDQCPVCRQLISVLPPQQAPADLSTARKALDTAAKSLRQAQLAHQETARAAAVATSALDATQARLDKAAEVMTDAPAEDELTPQLAAITAADDAVAQAAAQARTRQTEFATAERSRAALAAGEQQAWSTLSAARDKLVPLGAPVVATGPGQDLAVAWGALAAWAQAEHARLADRMPELEKAAAQLQEQVTGAAAALTELLAEHQVPAESLTRAAATVAEHRVRAETALHRIRDDRKQAARLDAQVAAQQQEAQVAGMLGNLLRANSFERWLCSEALDSLVREASGTLLELSGGQYELDRDERNDLIVVDHEDAGSRRPVHTLSGGETFQASLALALALSRQVIGLSAGMRELNSMFLDEGFGTLDSDTLETVASTLERLAADSDRMVGVVTHVGELAERVPVRFVVTRSGTTSAIVKERA